MSSARPLTINITGVDDAPRFAADAPTTASLAENADGSGSAIDIATVTASDAEGDTVTYSLVTPPAGFTINASSGAITYTGTGLDHETADSLTLTIRATSSGGTATHTVTVTVTDVNEPPAFAADTPTTGSIAENTDGSGTAVSIVTVTATDPDGDTVVYTLDPASIRQGFEIHAGTGAITYTGTGDDLDHETTASYTLTVTASSAGGSDTHTVTVTVTDVNEAPVFAGNTPTTGTLAEHVDGSSTAVDIVTVTASDPEGDTIAYSLDASSVSRGFAIHASTGAITYTGTGLDHESAETYALTVTATSSGGTASHIVTVTVSNIDEAPAFVANAPATASIHENRDGSSTAVAITTVTATDPDGDTVIYTLDPASIRNHFEINASTGAIIYTGTGLDRETTASYTLTVTATSSGGTDTHTVTVSVVDANESLAFDSGTPTTASLAENADGSSSAVGVVTVTATDPDGDTVTYSLVTPPAGFTINASSGAITYTGTGLDHETADSLTLTIRATSSGGTATHTVTVTVTDVNEAPLLALMAAQSVTDTTATDAFADLTGTFTATDADDGDTAFTFTVTGATANSTEAGFTHAVSNTYGTLFYNSTTGVWKFVVDAAAVNALDAGDAPQVTFSVTARDDGGLVSSARPLTINITGVDDAPRFAADAPTTASLAENADGSGSAIDIATVTASDAEGDTVTYSLVTPPAGFTINASSGAITYTGTGLDHETADSLTLTIRATSSGGTATHTVTVTVTDVNEPPAFAADTPTTGSIAENTDGSGTAVSIVTVTATDPDGDTVVYTLDPASIRQGFEIHAGTGAITYTGTGDDLDHETTASYTLTVTASSAGGSDTHTVTVTVTDVNEAPLLALMAAQSVTDTTATDAFADLTGTFTATDADDGDTAFTFTVTGATANSTEAGFTHAVSNTYGTLFYNSTTGVWKFVVDAAAVNALDAGDAPQVTFSVTARDDGGLVSSARPLTINITGVDDAPRFAADAPTTASLAENADGSGSAIDIATVTASDAEGDTVTYSLDATSTGNGFMVNASTGDITYTGSGFDHETQDTYTLTVTATSSGGTDTHTVTVTVTDRDEAPAFAADTPATGSIAENTDGSGTAIDLITVTATDPEADTITYSLDATSTGNGFTIDADTGAITYTGTGLDHEDEDTHTLTITATSSGGTATHRVTVTVTDLDEGPTFGTASSTVNFEENSDGSASAISITTITATDPDDDIIAYSLDITSIRNGFEIDTSTGAITYTGTGLDHETQDTYTLTVTATSSGGTDTHTVTVTVTDRDEGPVFAANAPTTASIAENADGSSSAIGLVTVTATDPDDDSITYSLVTPPAGFTINASSGDITYTGTGLDHETQDTYTLSVRATSSGGTATHTVTVTITDVNELLAFDSGTPTTASIDENTDGSGSAITLTTVTATDPDGDTVTYTLDSESIRHFFAIDASTGVITYTGNGDNLNHEGTASYTLTITASSTGGTATHQVTVTITDVDEAPVFDDGTPETASLAENASGSSTAVSVATVTATDPDGDTVTYSLDNAATANGFVINTDTGVITYTGSGFDHEDTDITTVTVTATSASGSVTHDVVISISDENEAPAFDTGTPTTGSINEGRDGSETGVSIVTVTASDPDGDTVTYSLDTTSVRNGFEIDTSTGVITYTGDGLDREEAANYTLTVTATSSGGSISHDVTVTVTNANEAPSFAADAATAASINENTDGSDTAIRIATVTATDPDGDTVTYSMTVSPTEDNFRINSSTGDITYIGSGLDHETQDTYTLTVTATSSGGTATHTVTVTVTDVNETPVLGSIATQTITDTSENDNVTDRTGTFSATDVDVDDTAFIFSVTGGTTDTSETGYDHSVDGTTDGVTYGTLFYNSTTGVWKFVVDAAAVNALDAGDAPQVTFSVTARDDGGLVSSARPLTINITGVDDAPRFAADAPTTASLAENADGSGTAIDLVTVTASDAEGDTVTYSLDATSTGNGFMVNASTGDITYTGSGFDHETQDTYTLTVTATSSGGTATHTVTVTVTDRDEAPAFAADTPATGSIAENTDGSGTAVSIVKVTATDPDGDTVIYTLDAVSIRNYFNIDHATGEITYTGSSLDHEDQDTFTLMVTATSNGGTDTHTVTVTVTDVDEGPVFAANAPTTATLDENADGSSSAIDLVTITATDPDDDSVSYSLVTPPAGFVINASTGAITYIGSGLDHETQDTYTLSVRATSSGGTATHTVTVTVTNVDEAPAFAANTPTTGTIAENDDGSNAAISITTVTATDPDGDTVTYSLDSVSTDKGFVIDAASGAITYTGSGLDHEDAASHSLTVTATSSGGTSTHIVTVTVTDSEEGPAFHPDAPTTVSINENADGSSTAITLATVTATDPEGDTITYSLVTPPSGFAINASTGAITYTGSGLDHETQDTYTLTITATSTGGTATHRVTVNVTDLNESLAFDSGTPTTASINENAVGSSTPVSVVTITATDLDGDAVTYSLAVSPENADFSIDASTGVITYIGPGLDHEAQDTYTLTITATTAGNTATHIVTVSVTDTDESPVFNDGTPETASLAENADGTITAVSIATVTATDPDGDTVTYSLDATSTGNGFAINASTGDITYTGSGLDHETQDTYTLTVTATSSGGTDTHTVTVTVTNEEEAPVFAADTPTTGSIAENTDGSGTAVDIVMVTATDPDGDTIVYTLDAASIRNYFNIDQATGAITYTGSSLDHERADTYTLTITATSNGGSDTHTVTITVTDTDEGPVFDANAPTTASIAENADGSDMAISITTVTATDPDDDAVTYSLDDTSAGNGFAINANTGVISYTGSGLDRETENIHTLIVTATSSGGTATHNIIISVNGVDEGPAFASDAPTAGTLAENTNGSASAVAIVTVTATDPDGDRIVYTLDAASIRNFFNIDQATGAITYTGNGDNLNHEVAASYTLTIMAISNGGTATHRVTVSITDTDEAPVFDDGTPETASLAENANGASSAIGVTAVTATDPDGDTVTYSLDTTSTNNGFAIESMSGAITYTGSGLDHETQDTYTLTVTATSSGGTDTHTVTVTVTNEEEAPVFDSDTPSTASINENADGSSSAISITTVTATDPDGDTIVYTLDAASIRNHFSIDQATGTITYTGPSLDHETQEDFTLTITATSNGGTATHDVTVTVTNVNEAPVLAATPAQQITDTAADDTFADDTATPLADIDIPTMSEGTILIHGIRFDLTSAADTDLAWRIVFTNTGRDLANLGTNLAAGVHLLSATANRRTIVYNLGASSLAVQTNIVNAINNDSVVRDLVTAEIENVITNANQQGRIAFADRAEYLISGDFTITTTAFDPPIVTSSTESERRLSVTGTITVDHDNNMDTDALAITSGGVDALYRLNSTDADFLAAHGLDANNDTWWVYAGTYGTLVIKDDGTFSYVLDATHASNATRVDDIFTINVTDADSNIHRLTLTVPVNHIDDAVKENVSITVEPNSSVIGAFAATDDDGTTDFTFDVTGSATDTTESGYTHSVNSTYGTLYYHNTNGNWKFVVNDAAVNGLDAGDTPDERFTVTATDIDGLTSVSETLVINITGADDAPRFAVDAPTTASLAENADGSGTAIPLVTVTASDVEVDTVSYSLDAVSTASGFAIHTSTGAITYTGTGLNHEEAETHTLTVTATSSGGTATHRVTVTVTDVNDAPSVDEIIQSIIDTAADDSFIDLSGLFNVTDEDEADTDFTFSIGGAVADDTQGDAYNRSVSNTYGTLYFHTTSGAWKFVVDASVINALDQGDTDSVSFSVTAEDDSNLASSSQNLTINITGGNDAPTLEVKLSPGFIFDTAATEDFSNMTGVFEASDVDTDNDAFTFDVDGSVEDTSQDGFTHSVTNDFGTLYFNQNPDDDSAMTSFIFVANSAAINSLDAGDTATANFSVTVKDANNLASSVQVLTLGIYGANDRPVVDTISVQTFTDTSASDNFTDRSGTFTATDIDADDTVVTFNVGGSTADSSEAGFDHSVNGRSGGVTYGKLYFNSINGSWKFVADAAAIDAIDDGETVTVTFNVKARDDANLASTGETFTITINGADDGPVFSASAPTTATIAENADGSGTAISLITVTASDAEADTITYSLDATSTANGFAINASTGAITYTGSGLNHEDTDTYTLTVTATSSGGTDTHTVTVTVTDADEEPTFSSNSSNASIVENNSGSSTAVSVTMVTATDVDGDRISYTLDNASIRNGFEIDATSGAITYTGEGLNREDASSYTLTVTATSSGGTATHTVTVTVTDVNEAPVFDADAPTTGTIAENQDGSSPAIDIVSVTASDAEGDTITYSLDATSIANGFAINASSGDITYTGSGFDHETTSTYTLTVTATSSGGTDTHTVTVAVTDVDEPPAFSSSTSSVSIDENADGSVTAVSVTTVTATDPDHDTITYILDTASIRNYFEINASTGEITYTGTGLDHETTATYTLTVTAVSSGGTATHTVTVTVTDIDEPPVFAASAPATASIPENMDGSSTAIDIATVTATDPDGDTVTYSLDTTSTNNGFAIDSTTGAITYTGSGLDHETQDTYTLTVTATSSGGTNTHTVTVSVTDVNEGPVFNANAPTTGSIAENTDGSSTAVSIAIVSATDPDGDTITYSISGHSDFKINASTGEITYEGTGLNFEIRSTYVLTITATSSGGTATHVVTVSVTNVVESIDFSADSPTAGSILENIDSTTVATFIAEFVAVDTERGTITYSIDATAIANDFDINASNGKLYYEGSGLDREEADSHTIIITATSTSGTTATHSIIVAVGDVNEAPFFSADTPTTGSVEENTDGSTTPVEIVTITATDPESDTITYGLDATSRAYGFAIDSATGTISYTGTGLNRKFKHTYSLTVTAASIGGSVSHDVTVTVTGDIYVSNTSDLTKIVIFEGDFAVLGSLNFIEADEARIDSFSPSTGSYGSLIIDDDGNWRYVLDSKNDTVSALNTDDTLTETITVTITFDTDKTITQALNITINGRDARHPENPSGEQATAGTPGDDIVQGGNRDDTLILLSLTPTEEYEGGNDVAIGGYGEDSIFLGYGIATVVYRFSSGSGDDSWKADDGFDNISSFKPDFDTLILLDTDDTPITLEDLIGSDSQITVTLIVGTDGDRLSGIDITFPVSGQARGDEGKDSGNTIRITWPSGNNVTFDPDDLENISEEAEKYLGIDGAGYNPATRELTDLSLLINYFRPEGIQVWDADDYNLDIL